MQQYTHFSTKNILAVFAALALLFGLTACGNEKQSTDSGASGSATEAQKDAEAEASDTANDDTAENTQFEQLPYVQSFKAFVKDHLNVADYTENITNGNRIHYFRQDESDNLDFTVTLDGFSFTLPVKYSDLIDAGWTDQKDFADETLEKDTFVNTDFTTAAGNKVSLIFVNTGDEEIKVADSEAMKVSFNYAFKDGKIEETAPDFTVYGSIGNNTDLAGILATAGDPKSIDLSYTGAENSVAHTTVTYRNGDDRITFDYLFAHEKIETVTLEYQIAGVLLNY